MKQFAIIGCGRISKKHADNITRIGKLAAVCDIVEERANELADKHKAKAYYNIDDLLAAENEIDCVAVCTPNGLHAEHIIKSLQAGKDVLSEKPLCLTKAAAWQIIETEKFCRKQLFVVKSSRYNPLLIQLKKLIAEKALGKLYSFHLSCIWSRTEDYYTDWRGKLFPDGGTLYNQFSHYVDAMLWLFGEMKEVKGFKTNAAHPSIEIEDTGAVALQMENDLLGTMHWSVNAFKKNHEIALTILTEKGTIRIGGEYLNEVQYAALADGISFSNDLSFSPSSYDHHKQIYDQLVESWNNSNNKLPNAFDGLRTVETIEKIYKAIS